MLANKGNIYDSPGTFNIASNLTTRKNVNCPYLVVNKASSIDWIKLNQNEYNSNQFNAFNSSQYNSILSVSNALIKYSLIH